MMKADVVILGGGPAGLAAAIASRDAGARDVLILERDRELGGILQQCIHNGFGLHYFGEELTGPEYAQRFIDEAMAKGARAKTGTMVLSLSPDRVITAVNPEDGLITIKAGAAVLAMGCRERTRGALAIPGTRPSGVYTAGCAQRLNNMEGYQPGKDIVILGSGDIGLIMARRMTWEGARVRMVCEIMPYSGGLTRNIVQCLEDNGIPLRLSHTVVNIHGRERLTGVTVARVDERLKPVPGTYEYVPCDTLLLSVGLIPENELSLGASIEMDPVTRGAVVDQFRQTSIPGIFACGNVLHVHDLVDHVSREAMIAGETAARFAAGDAGEGNILALQTAGLARYTVPQRIRISGDTGAVNIFYRVGNIARPAVVEVRSGDAVLVRRRKPIMTPGEMESITLPAQAVRAADPKLPIVIAVKEEVHPDGK
ncbi:MAG: NAD(P)/FAD-dependent oxidoreductase [Christensenellales bacterium]|jgi:thioredoxin reductase